MNFFNDNNKIKLDKGSVKRIFANSFANCREDQVNEILCLSKIENIFTLLVQYKVIKDMLDVNRFVSLISDYINTLMPDKVDYKRSADILAYYEDYMSLYHDEINILKEHLTIEGIMKSVTDFYFMDFIRIYKDSVDVKLLYKAVSSAKTYNISNWLKDENALFKLCSDYETILKLIPTDALALILQKYDTPEAVSTLLYIMESKGFRLDEVVVEVYRYEENNIFHSILRLNLILDELSSASDINYNSTKDLVEHLGEYNLQAYLYDLCCKKKTSNVISF